jgi:hypothetical protein
MLCLAVRELGWSVRIAHGFMVGLPLSNRHSWAEILVEGTWVPVDPVILNAMQRFAGLDEHAWPHARSIGPMLVHFSVGPKPVPLVSRDDEWLQVVYLTSVET